jgi:hypothetical protein
VCATSPPAKVIPSRVRRCPAGQFEQFLAAPHGKALQEAQAAGEDPGSGDVGVRVVIQPRHGGTRVAVVVLVGADDTTDAVASQAGVEDGQVSPEAGDLQHHLRALGVQVLRVTGGLAVLTHVVGDRRADVVLEPGAVGQPAPRVGVEVPLLVSSRPSLLLWGRAALGGHQSVCEAG